MGRSRVFAFVVASLVTSAAVAQAQSTVQPARGARQEMRGPGAGRGAGGALRGIALGDAERASLQAIHAKYAAEGRALRDSLRPAMKELRAARQKGDTLAAKAVFDRNKGARDQVKALRDRQRAEIRAALTPEHQKLFDANVARVDQRRAELVNHGRGKGMKHGRHAGRAGGHRGHRPGTNG